MASRNTKRVNERLRLAEQAAAQGNFQAAVNYAAAAIPFSRSQSSTQNVLNVINAYSAAGRPAETGSGAPTNPGNPDPGDGGAPPPRSVVSTFTRRALGGRVETVRVWSDGSQDVIDSFVSKTAGESAAEMFRAAGLGEAFVNSLMATIDAVYASNIDPSEAQILNSIYNSEAYKTRFAGNEMIRKRIADGKGRPGDRLLTPKEYIDAENAYRTVLQDAGMPTGFYDQPDDFNNLIGNSISIAEFKSRVDTAGEALNNADQSVVNTLSRYYNMTRGDLVSYLLDPTRAMPILEGRAARAAQAGVDEFGLNSRTELQRVFEASKVGGMADRQGLAIDRGFSEEIVDMGKSNQAEEALNTAGALDPDLRRLGSIYGQPLDFKDLVRETLSLSGGVEAGRKRRKFASKERAAFSAQGALDKTSLSRMQDV